MSTVLSEHLSGVHAEVVKLCAVLEAVDRLLVEGHGENNAVSGLVAVAVDMAGRLNRDLDNDTIAEVAAGAGG